MRHFSRTLSLLAILAGSARCQCIFTFNPPSADISQAGASDLSFSVSASNSTCSRQATASGTWITVNYGQTGSGNGTVGYSVASNPTYATRVGTISVGGTPFKITQQGLLCTYSLSTSSQSAQPSGGTFTVSIATPCMWTASTTAPWITLKTTSGTGSVSLSYTVGANTGFATRTGTIQIDTQILTVTQSSDCSYTVSPSSATISATGGQYQITVQATDSICPWTVQNSVSWISNLSINGASVTMASGNGTLNYSVAPNSPRKREQQL